MVKLDYRTNNPRWGLKGIKFCSWESYSVTLGYLSNPFHYSNLYPVSQYANVSLHIEGNDEQGAWDKEGRIHYYGRLSDLKTKFEDLANCRSAGNGRITCRINSNGYILSLINDHNFKVVKCEGHTTANIFPSEKNSIETSLIQALKCHRLPYVQIKACVKHFNNGYEIFF